MITAKQIMNDEGFWNALIPQEKMVVTKADKLQTEKGTAAFGLSEAGLVIWQVIQRRYQLLVLEAPKIETPIEDGGYSHLFSVSEINQLKRFAAGFAVGANRADTVTTEEWDIDEWNECRLAEGSIADIHFCINDDDESPNYNKLEAFAYRTRVNGRDLRETDTDDCIRLL